MVNKILYFCLKIFLYQMLANQTKTLNIQQLEGIFVIITSCLKKYLYFENLSQKENDLAIFVSFNFKVSKLYCSNMQNF